MKCSLTDTYGLSRQEISDLEDYTIPESDEAFR